MKRYVHDRSTVDMLDAFQGKLDELRSSQDVSASEYDEEENEFELLERKDVQDSDGFWTKYSLYQNMNTGEFVTVFGDPDLYGPEDGYYDAEFDDYGQAIEWFDDYNGIYEED